VQKKNTAAVVMFAAISYSVYSWKFPSVHIGLFLKNIQENKDYSTKSKELKCRTPVSKLILSLSNGSH